MIQLVYISKAKPNLNKSDIDAILKEAIPFNKQHEITGTLMLNSGIFMQLLEGDPLSIDFLLEKKIKKSTKHQHITVLFKRETNKRIFSEWNMSFLQLDEFDLKIINKIMAWNTQSLTKKEINPDEILNLLEGFKHKAKDKA